MKYHIITYGCQTNYADSEKIARRLENQGYVRTNKIEQADTIVINACSVRQSAMDRVYAKINKYCAQQRNNNEVRLRCKKFILAGCVLPADKKKLKNKVTEIWHPDEYFDSPADKPAYSDGKIAYVPIATGCNNFCTYCAVPYTRGREKSRRAGEIIKEVKNLIKNGYKEIWLLGQNVNSYTDKSVKFPTLLKTINKLSGNFKINFLSSHPKDMSDELIKTIADCEKVSKEIHLPLQSGDNAILKKMNRKYTIGHYKNLIKKIREHIPDAKISTDIIVGFPGETKQQFKNTTKAMEEIKFSKAYIACYSPRPGTAAAKLKDNISHQEKKERRKILERILNNLPKIIVIIGPTASGKSALAIAIAKKFNGEIVSADSRQIYREMNIGTAKATKKEMIGIQHHLINIKNPDEDYSAGQYKKDAINAINKIIASGKLPILVGGTGLYISAVINNWEIPQIKENKKLRRQLEKEISNKGLAFVFNKLITIDPEAAYIVDPKNPRRVIRALEIALVSGKKFSEQRKTGKQLYDILEIGINPPANILKKRIFERIKQMIKMGLVKEVKNLIKKYGENCKALDAIGYREIIDYLKNSDFSLEKAIEQMNKNTQCYAKRQMTWFKKYNPKTHWFSSSAAESLKNKKAVSCLFKKFYKYSL